MVSADDAEQHWLRAGQALNRLCDQSAKHAPLAGLSKQERKIPELIGEGLTNRQIGERPGSPSRRR